MAQQTKLRVAGENAQVLVRAIGHDHALCLREQSKDATCRRCADVCPGKAINIQKSTTTPGGHEVSISKASCIDCGLCCAVCPTGGMTILEPTIRTIRRRLKKADKTVDESDERRGHVYLTCVETGLAKKDPSVVELPCLGLLTWEMWANLMLDFPNLAVFLPSDLCGRCKAKVAEMMIVDEVVRAQEVTGSEMPLVESMRELDFTTANGSLRPDRVEKYRDKGDSFGAILRDMTTKRINEDDMLTEDLGPYDAKRMRVRLRKEISSPEAEGTPGLAGAVEEDGEPSGFGGTLTHARWALLDALMRYPAIADKATVTCARIDAAADEKDVARCAQACIPGAIATQGEPGEAGFSFEVRPALCTSCGLCADILGEAAGTRDVPCRDLLA